jgi:predicted AlkP superfamily pyrophosphatase or phosphodiesterase
MGGLKMRGVILIIIDGCRSEALNETPAETINHLMEQGAFSLTAQTVTPSITLPVHFSIFTSMDPKNHGILTNTARPYPSSQAWGIIDIAKNQRRTTAAIYNWEHLRELSAPGALDYSLFINNVAGDNSNLEIFQAASFHLTCMKPDFCFIYTSSLDAVGHNCGFMSKDYLAMLEKIDDALAFFMERMEMSNLHKCYNMVLQSDHGGIGKHHYEPVPEVLTVPWIATGPEIKSGHIIEQKLSVLDTVPTLAKLMNIYGHHAWEGSIVNEIFLDDAETMHGLDIAYPSAVSVNP